MSRVLRRFSFSMLAMLYFFSFSCFLLPGHRVFYCPSSNEEIQMCKPTSHIFYASVFSQHRTGLETQNKNKKEGEKCFLAFPQEICNVM